MPMVKRVKIEHPTRALWWSCSLNEWTSDDNEISDWPIIDEDEAYAIADDVGGIVEEFTRHSILPDTYARPIMHVRHAAE